MRRRSRRSSERRRELTRPWPRRRPLLGWPHWRRRPTDTMDECRHASAAPHSYSKKPPPRKPQPKPKRKRRGSNDEQSNWPNDCRRNRDCWDSRMGVAGARMRRALPCLRWRPTIATWRSCLMRRLPLRRASRRPTGRWSSPTRRKSFRASAVRPRRPSASTKTRHSKVGTRRTPASECEVDRVDAGWLAPSDSAFLLSVVSFLPLQLVAPASRSAVPLS